MQLHLNRFLVGINITFKMRRDDTKPVYDESAYEKMDLKEKLSMSQYFRRNIKFFPKQPMQKFISK